MLRFVCHTCGCAFGMHGNHHNLPRNTQELILYSPFPLLSNPVHLFSLFFQKNFVKIETIRKYRLVLPCVREKSVPDFLTQSNLFFRSQLTAEAHQRTQEENRRITASVVKRTIRALRVMSERTARTGCAGFGCGLKDTPRNPDLFG